MSENPKNQVEFKSADGKFEFTQHEDDDGVFHGKPAGFQDAESSYKIVELIESTSRRVGKKLLYVLDVSGLDEITPEARKVLSDWALPAESVFERLAVLGGNFFMRTLFNMWTKVSKSFMRMFKVREKALSWLKEGNEK
jgi:hypothetical protein